MARELSLSLSYSFSSPTTTEGWSILHGKIEGSYLKRHQLVLSAARARQCYVLCVHTHAHTCTHMHTHTHTHTHTLHCPQGIHPTMGTSHAKFTNYSFDVPEFMRLVTRLGDSVLQRKKEYLHKSHGSSKTEL